MCVHLCVSVCECVCVCGCVRLACCLWVHLAVCAFPFSLCVCECLCVCVRTSFQKVGARRGNTTRLASENLSPSVCACVWLCACVCVCVCVCAGFVMLTHSPHALWHHPEGPVEEKR